MNVTPEQILGWSKVILDTYGITPLITVILFVSVASYVYRTFIRKD